MDLSNDVLNIDFGQEAAKIQEVKVERSISYLFGNQSLRILNDF